MEAKDDSKVEVEIHSPDTSSDSTKSDGFKKPQMCLVGQRKSKGAKIRLLQCSSDPKCKDDTHLDNDSVIKPEVESPSRAAPAPAIQETDKLPPPQVEKKTESDVSQKSKESAIPYLEPKWGGIPEYTYSMDVIKSGTSLDPLDLTSKSFFVFGRQKNCDVQMAHPTISRYHAVLQYSIGTEERPQGFYIYDLGSTHGTFLNKSRIRPEMFIRMKVGHQIKLGCSTRIYLLQGPPDDMEEESEFTVTELKAKRQLELLERERAEISRKEKEEEEKQKMEENGIDWGMGDDADEETDLTENPYAATTNEELYIDDPKKTLRGWFEREGHELEYDVEEKGPGHFLCRIEIPVEGARGGSVVAEALLKGKKKEAVAQCALEACRLLDRLGLLRQATHESRKRKAKNWEEDDFYDSDEDTFLDRTGAVEKKRQLRMHQAGKGEVQVETFQSLSDKHSDILKKIDSTQVQLKKVQDDLAIAKRKKDEDRDGDSLDSFMNDLSKVGCSDKKLLSKLKSDLLALTKEEAQVRKLVNIARPANLPELAQPSLVLENDSPKDSNSMRNKLMVSARRKASEKHKIMLTSSQHRDQTHGVPIEKKSSEKEELEDAENISNLEGIESTSKKFNEPEEAPRIGPSKTSLIWGKTPGNDSETMVEDKKDLHEDRVCDDSDDKSVREAEKRRKRNQRRLLLRKEKALEKTNESYDSSDPNYSVWVPPEDQSGDGTTKLNAKLGY